MQLCPHQWHGECIIHANTQLHIRLLSSCEHNSHSEQTTHRQPSPAEQSLRPSYGVCTHSDTLVTSRPFSGGAIFGCVAAAVAAAAAAEGRGETGGETAPDPGSQPQHLPAATPSGHAGLHGMPGVCMFGMRSPSGGGSGGARREARGSRPTGRERVYRPLRRRRRRTARGHFFHADHKDTMLLIVKLITKYSPTHCPATTLLHLPPREKI